MEDSLSYWLNEMGKWSEDQLQQAVDADLSTETQKSAAQLLLDAITSGDPSMIQVLTDEPMVQAIMNWLVRAGLKRQELEFAVIEGFRIYNDAKIHAFDSGLDEHAAQAAIAGATIIGGEYERRRSEKN